MKRIKDQTKKQKMREKKMKKKKERINKKIKCRKNILKRNKIWDYIFKKIKESQHM